jgi:hypothetical protein
MEQKDSTVIDRGCSGVLRMQRRHSRRAWVESRLEMMEHETLWGLLMEVWFRCFTPCTEDIYGSRERSSH